MCKLHYSNFLYFFENLAAGDIQGVAGSNCLLERGVVGAAAIFSKRHTACLLKPARPRGAPGAAQFQFSRKVCLLR